MTATMTAEEIVRETVEFFSKNPRAVNPKTSGCTYQNSRGDCCAVGRCLEEDSLAYVAEYEEKHGEFSVLHFKEKIGSSLDENLQEKYVGQSIDFWNFLQMLHDTPSFWGEKGLTKRGEEFVEAKFGFGI